MVNNIIQVTLSGIVHEEKEEGIRKKVTVGIPKGDVMDVQETESLRAYRYLRVDRIFHL